MFSKNFKEDYKYIKQDLIDYFSINYDLPFTSSKLYKSYGIKGAENRKLFDKILDELVKEKIIFQTKSGGFQYFQSELFLEGKIDFVNPNYAFAIDTGTEKDVFIPSYDLNGAFHQDLVKIIITKKAKTPNTRPEGKVIEILERGIQEIVGTLEIKPNYAFLIADSKKIHQDFYIPKSKIGKGNHLDKVIAKITGYGNNDKKPEAEVLTVLGKSGENETEINSIINEFNLPTKFSDEIEEIANSIPEEIPIDEIKKRRDFRKTLTFTIDPIDAKDFDDAISYKELGNQEYEIGVHIADVSHYVQPNTLLDKEAYLRGTSVYLVDRVIPMLPERLSNGLCSLRPNEDKLTFSAVFKINEKAEILEEWFGRTIIHSDKRFAYEEAQELIEGNISKDQDFIKPILTLNKIALKLRESRFQQGAVNFDSVELKFNLDEKGKPISVFPRIRKDAHKLIEEFMLLANKRVAMFVYHLKKSEPRNSMIYRVHEAPDPEKLKVFSNFAKKFGYKVSTDIAQISGSFNRMMDDIVGKKEENLLQSLAVRTMAKARYSTDRIGHFGLSFPFYSHFTSPIRRYPDMIAHRLLQLYLDGANSQNKELIEAQSKHCSDKEKIAAEAERASIKYKQVEFISLKEPQIFKGTVSGVTENGLYVEIENTSCEGMIRMTDLTDDFYELDKENYRIIGKRSRRIFTFGDELEVTVKDTNLTRRTIDLELVGLPNDRMNSRAKAKSRKSPKNKFKVIPRGKKRNKRR